MWLVRLLLVASLGILPYADASAQDFAKEWSPLQVPGAWEDVSAGKLANYDGYAWYRCWVKVPNDWKGRDLSLAVEQIANVHEVFWNGIRIGGGGDFPPGYRDASASNSAYSYTVNEKNIEAGQYHLVAVRVYNQSGKGGFKGTAPALVNETTAIALQGTWQFRTGDDPAWAKPVADRPKDQAVFLKVVETTSLPRPTTSTGAGLKPADAAKTFTAPDDLRFDQVLADPIVRQPVALSFDERGRLWVVQYLQYPNPAGLKVVSRDMFWRVIYDKVPLPPPHHFKGNDKITIHEDTLGNGIYDKHTTFADGLNIATSVLPGRGGVFVLNPPYLLFYPSEDGTRASGDPRVLLEGFGIEDCHSTASNLRWGVDGWIYGAIGSTVTGTIKRPGDKEPVARMVGQHIWRYHPEKKEFEIFAEGGGNAWGVEIDNLGRVFSGHNGGNTRGFHYVQGGSYRKGFEKHGQLANPFSFGFFEHMKHNDVQRFTHNFTICDSPALPHKYQGHLFGVAPLQGHVTLSKVMPDRSSVQTRDLNPAVTSKDSWFRPVDIQHGPDGLYIADMYEGYIAHLRHYEGQVDRDTGRIYRLAAKEVKPAKYDLTRKSTSELISLLASNNRWERHTVLRMLGDRRDATQLKLLENLATKSRDAREALHGLWALNLSGGFRHELVPGLLNHPEAQVRAWTVRLVGDEKKAGAQSANLADLAKREKDVVVRSQLACSARRLPASECLPIVRNLLDHDEDQADIHVPLLLWWALESKCGSDREAVLELFRDSRLWTKKLVEETILPRLMKRFALAGSRKDLEACVRLLRLAPEKKHGRILVKGFEEAFQGRSIAGLPQELLEEIAKLGGGSIPFGVRLGRPEALAEALALVQNSKTAKAQREEIIAILGEAQQAAAVPILLDLLGGKESDLHKAALSALQAFKDDKIGVQVVKLYPALQGEVREVAESLLASRKQWTQTYLNAVETGAISAKSVPHDTLKKMLLHRDAAIGKLIKKHWGEIKGATTAEMHKEIARLQVVLNAAPGSPYPGKKLFTTRCAACHVLHGRGGQVGPDLTPLKRDDFANLLLHIVNPSAEIREGFENTVVVTEGGRILTGIVLEKDLRVVVLRLADGQKVVLPRDDIAEMSVTGVSLMPEGILNGLTEQEVRDLFAYLRSTQPLNDGT